MEQQAIEALLLMGFACIIAFCVSRYISPLILSIAIRCNVLDNPDNILKKHDSPTPYLGGIVVFVGFIVSVALVMPVISEYSLLILGMSILLFVGLSDDFLVMTPLKKFWGQCIAVLCFLRAETFIKARFLSSLSDNIFIYAFWYGLSGLWMLTIINSVNLIDVMDGLATTVAMLIITSTIFFAFLLKSYSILPLLGAFFKNSVVFLS